MPARRSRAHENTVVEAGPPVEEAGGLLTIDVTAIAANWRELARRSEPAECAAVVKADAYGLGLEPVVRGLASAGCVTFFVAHLAEGRAARAAASNAVVYVLNGLAPGTADSYARADLRPVVGSLAELTEWNRFCAQSGFSGFAALHVDTGINRLGLTPEETADVAKRDPAGRRGISLLISHFACAEEPGHPLNAKQMAEFRDVRALFPSTPASIANSSGIFLGPDAHHDMVRPGVALYGANPTPGHINLMHPVVRLDGRIIQVRDVPEGESVGYGATWTARRPTRLAIVSIGYADGFVRAASVSDLHPGAEAIVAGRRCPLAGRISMDLLGIDVTDVPGDAPARGDWATLLGDEIGVDELASHAGTIAYEILTSLGRRYRRVHRGIGVPSC
jgi:alanine racemase